MTKITDLTAGRNAFEPPYVGDAACEKRHVYSSTGHLLRKMCEITVGMDEVVLLVDHQRRPVDIRAVDGGVHTCIRLAAALLHQRLRLVIAAGSRALISS